VTTESNSFDTAAIKTMSSIKNSTMTQKQQCSNKKNDEATTRTTT